MTERYKLVCLTQKALSISLEKYKNNGISDAIAPFGFELLNIYNVPSFSLRRIYIYVRATDETVLLDFALDFCENMRVIYPHIGKRISSIKYNNSTYKLEEVNHHVKVYVSCIAEKVTLLEAYSDYINLSSKYIANKTHPQVKKFNTNNVSRGHVLQLFLMSLRLTDNNNHLNEEIIVKDFIKRLNRSWGGGISEEATGEEKKMLTDTIIPYFLKNEEAICNLSKIEGTIILQCKAFHGDSLFERVTPLSLVEEYRDFVSIKYKPPVSYG